MRFLYNIAMHLYGLLVRLAALRLPKARLWVAGRKDIFTRLGAAIDPSERWIWVHVASLGEFEQGRPIVEKIRAEHPEYKILITFFSPSGYEIRKNYEGADAIFYLPLDTPRNARRFVEIVRPEVAIFVKYEFWLNLLHVLRRAGVRSYIVSAIFRRDSIFFRPYGGAWRRALRTFTTIFVQDDASLDRLARIGFENVVVAGDTRFDRVAEIVRTAKKIDPLEHFCGKNRVFIAGSTWPPDEDLLVKLINNTPEEVKFILAPHEIDAARITRLIASIDSPTARYTDKNANLTNARVLVLDTIGLLASAYSYATWAYIGGGFGVGIHNTLEAATFGLPIAFGPHFERFKEACDLVTTGAATPIRSYEELSAWFARVRTDEAALRQCRAAARDYTESHQGATELILRSIF